MGNNPQIGIGALVAFLAAYMLIVGIIAVFVVICEWKILTKAGKPGWACLVPIYNLIIFLEIIGKPWWYIFMFLIPIYGWFILPIICINRFSKSYGQGVGFTVGLLFLPIIFIAITAFSSSIKYVGPGGVPAPVPAS
ncbi:MAG TPA: DUF5684 domain-containing protein [Bacteroidia bacterium]|jgi:hypothetical protein|nr:DUF5684 domain-containing protein [Bacteroidia bacterium]